MTFLYPILFAVFIGFVFRVSARVSQKSLIDLILIAYIVFCGSIILAGFVISEIHKMNDRRFWAVGVFIPAFIFFVQFTKFFGNDRKENFTVFQIIGSRIQMIWNWFGSLSTFFKTIFGGLILTLTIIEVTNLLLIFYTPPNEWDSMTGHLNRLLYYIQHGTMAHFGGTNWNIDSYPRSACTIQIYAYLMSGKIENWFKAIHHIAYWMIGFGMIGIVRSITKNITASLFCALIILLLPNVLKQAITTESDIVLASYLASLVYFLFSFREKKKRRYLYLAGIVFGIAFGHKITFAFSLPPIFLIIVYAVFKDDNYSNFFALNFKHFKHLFTAFVLGFCLFTVPSGYIDNIRDYNHPIGPPTALRHQSIDRAGTKKNLVKQGTRNFFRYSIDLLSLDGLRNWKKADELNSSLQKPLIYFEKNIVKSRLEEETNFTIVPFTYHRRFEFYNGSPFYGIFGFGLIFPLILLVFFRIIKNKEVFAYLGIAFVLHILALSFTAPYDPWKGRYMISSAVFCVPFLSLLFLGKKSIDKTTSVMPKIYVGFVVIIGIMSALLSVFLNYRCLPIAAYGRVSAFEMRRIALQTEARPDITKAYEKFNEIVPQNASVALATINDDYEYPLWGDKLTRKLYVINPFEKGLQPIPKSADYLFFDKSLINPQLGDIRLGTDTLMKGVIVRGEDYYLRKLKP
jgi:Dolichyl-phosphate-mannose-protein mannosyltransferase